MRLLNKYPLAVQSVQTGVLCGAGDLISQTLIEKKAVNSVDGWRSLKFAAIGSLWIAPLIRFWYIRYVNSQVYVHKPKHKLNK